MVSSLEKKTVQEFPANDTDNELINKLSSENEHLKEFPVNVTDNELINKLTSENEHLKERISSLEKKTALEIPANFIENELINKLTVENEQLKEQVNSLEKRIDEIERKYDECSKLSEERMNQIIETESKMIEIKTNMQRLEEKLSDMETENQVLRQQTLLSSSSRKMSGKFLPTTVESIEALFKCMTKDLGFCEGKPVAAFTLYNCLLHWKSFEAKKTSIFDRLIQLIGSKIESSFAYARMSSFSITRKKTSFQKHREVEEAKKKHVCVDSEEAEGVEEI